MNARTWGGGGLATYEFLTTIPKEEIVIRNIQAAEMQINEIQTSQRKET